MKFVISQKYVMRNANFIILYKNMVITFHSLSLGFLDVWKIREGKKFVSD